MISPVRRLPAPEHGVPEDRTPSAAAGHGGDVLAVVVAYRRSWPELLPAAVLAAELCEAGSGKPDDRGRLTLRALIVYDNSPASMAVPPPDTFNVTYLHDAGNGGTRSAYAFALQEASRRGIEWVLLVDQDTALPAAYLQRASEALSDAVDVLLPRVAHGRSAISPARVSTWGGIQPIRGAAPSRMQSTLDSRAMTAIASGAILRVRALELLRELPAGLWLDYVDHYLFHRIHAAGFRIAVVDVDIDHDLSVRRLSKLPPQRLHSIWDGERTFVSALGRPARCLYPFRLLARLARLALTCPTCALELLSWTRRRITA